MSSELSERDTRFAEARRRLPAPGRPGEHVSYTELATLVNAQLHADGVTTYDVTGHYLAKLERGIHHWPSPARRTALRKVLGADTDADLGFYPRHTTDLSSSTLAAQEPRHPGIDSTSTSGQHTRLEPSAAGIVAVEIDGDEVSMLRRTVVAGSITAAAHQLLRFAMPDERSNELSPTIVAGLADTAAQYRLAYHSVPAAALLPAAIAHFRLVVSLAPAARPSTQRTALLTAAGEMAALAGVILALDSSRRHEAMSYLDIAWNVARAVEDCDLQAVVLGCRSFALSYGNGDHRAALECVDYARQIGSKGASFETQAWVAAVASERCASLGDFDGCRSRLDESRSALISSPDHQAVWRGIGGFNAAKLRAYEGGDMVRLGRYQDAETILTQALDELDPTMPRHRATALVDRAEAHLAALDFDSASQDAAQALDLVVQVQHTGNLRRISTVATHGAAAGSRAAQVLQQQVRTATAELNTHTREINKQ